MKSLTKIFLFTIHIRYVTIKDSKYSKYVKVNNVNPLFLLFGKVNGYFEEINENKYLALVPTGESKKKNIKKCEELGSKIRDLIRSITKNLDDYNESYIKIKFDSVEKLPLNKTIEIPFVNSC